MKEKILNIIDEEMKELRKEYREDHISIQVLKEVYMKIFLL